MPIYEYRCPQGHIFEMFQRMSDPSPEACEICAASPVERVLQPIAVHFKGSGFYATDYGRGSRRQAKETAPSESGGPSSGESAKKDTKPAASDS